ncbi:MAG: hypothetical protein WC900_04530 [Oscillospiraceae bacterium]|jgi:hypothetical protein
MQEEKKIDGEKGQEGKDYGDILKGNAMSVEEIEEKKKGGLLWIKARQDELIEAWKKRFNPESIGGQGIELSEDQLKKLAYEWADLENDFNFIRDVAEYTGARYAEFMGLLPSLEEMDLLLDLVQDLTDGANYAQVINIGNGVKTNDLIKILDFFRIGTKEERIKKLQKLKALVKGNLA